MCILSAYFKSMHTHIIYFIYQGVGAFKPTLIIYRIVRVKELYEKSSLTNPSVIVDTNHNNSGKMYLEQIRIAKDIVHSRNQNSDIKHLVKGLMIESYLEDGAQGVGEHVFGKSITDPCLGWEKTERLILDIADKL